MTNRKRLTIAATVGGIALLAAAGAWTKAAPVTARRAAPQTVRPPTLSEAEAEHLFRRVLLRCQQVSLRFGGRCGNRDPWLVEDAQSDAPIARLFARAYPDLCKRLIVEILEDPESPKVDRQFMVQILFSLPDWTSDALEELLRSEVERTDDDYHAALTLYALGLRDRGMRHRDLYERLCRAGLPNAFLILSFSVHSRSLELLKELAKESEDRHQRIRDGAEGALARLRILQSPDWKNTVEKYITKAAQWDADVENFMWACEVARRRNLPGYLDWLAIRSRSDLGARTWPGDGLTDYALAQFAQAGGELTPAERARLRPNGFVGDPEQRLLEILTEKRIR